MDRMVFVRWTLVWMIGSLSGFAVAQEQSTFWVLDDVVTRGDVGNDLQLAMDSDGHSHIVHYDFAAKRVVYTFWDGFGWNSRVAIPGVRPSLLERPLDIETTDSGGVVIVAAVRDTAGLAPLALNLARFDRSGAFVDSSTLEDDFDFDISRGFDLDVVGGDQPAVLMLDDVPNALSLGRWSEAEGFVKQALLTGGEGILEGVRLESCRIGVGSGGDLHVMAVGVRPTEFGVILVHGREDVSGAWNWEVDHLGEEGLGIDGFDDYRMRIDAAGEPRIATVVRRRIADSELGILRKRVGAWEYERVFPEGFFTWKLAYDVDSDGGDHIVSVHSDLEGVRRWRYYVEDSEGVWTARDIMRDDSSAIGDLDPSLEGSGARDLDLALDPFGRPHLAFDTGVPYSNLIHGILDVTRWSISEVESSLVETYNAPDIDAPFRSRPTVAYHVQNSQNFGENQLRVATYDPSENHWGIETVMEATNRPIGLNPKVRVDQRSRPGVISYNIGLGSYEYARRVDGEWLVEPIAAPGIDDSAGELGRHGYIGKLGSVDRVVALYEDAIGGLRIGFRGAAGWSIGLYSPLPQGQRYWLWDAVEPLHGAFPGSVYCVYGSRQFDLRLGIWDGEGWSSEALPLDGIPGAFVRAVSLTWDATARVPVVAFIKDAGSGGSPIYVARRDRGDTELGDWDISTIAEPSISLTDLEADFTTNTPVVSYSALLRPITVLIRETIGEPWVEETIRENLGAGSGLSMKVVDSNIWVAYPSRSLTSVGASLRVAVRSLDGVPSELSGVVDYGERPTIGWNALDPCPNESRSALSGGSGLSFQSLAPPFRLIPPSARQALSMGTVIPAESADSDLDVLRSLRDRLIGTETGRRWLDIYYANKVELGRIALENPSLLFEAYQLFQNIAPALEALGLGAAEEFLIDENSVGLATSVLDRLEAAGSPSLASAIDVEREGVGDMSEFIGRSFESAGQAVGAVVPAVGVLGAALTQSGFRVELIYDDSKRYELIRSSSLGDGGWEVVPSVARIEGGVVILEDEAPLEGQAFYQARTTPIDDQVASE